MQRWLTRPGARPAFAHARVGVPHSNVAEFLEANVAEIAETLYAQKAYAGSVPKCLEAALAECQKRMKKAPWAVSCGSTALVWPGGKAAAAAHPTA